VGVSDEHGCPSSPSGMCVRYHRLVEDVDSRRNDEPDFDRIGSE
jgi:hypothetical protein